MYRTLRAPISVQIEVTEYCDNCCLHCYNFWRVKDATALHSLPSFTIMRSNTLPRLEVKEDKEQDKKLFVSFMQDGGVNYRKIINSYLKLKSEEIVPDFIDQLYSQYKSQIDKIIEKEAGVLKGANNTIFSGLEKVMGCGWDSSLVFYAIPTFLPFCPFGKNCFYFSIYNEVIEGKENRRRVDRIAIHELSHMCWYQKLEKAYKELGFELNHATNYYLKEAFAAIIGECEEFSKINGGHSPANNNVSLLRVVSNGKEMEFVDFFRKLFNEGRKKGLDFDAILKEVLRIGQGIQNELDEKWSLWNKYGDSPDKLSESGYQSRLLGL